MTSSPCPRLTTVALVFAAIACASGPGPGPYTQQHVTVDSPSGRIDMLLTTPFCPYAPQMIADVQQAVRSVVPQECVVEILPDAWSPDMMPDPSLLGFSY